MSNPLPTGIVSATLNAVLTGHCWPDSEARTFNIVDCSVHSQDERNDCTIYEATLVMSYAAHAASCLRTDRELRNIDTQTSGQPNEEYIRPVDFTALPDGNMSILLHMRLQNIKKRRYWFGHSFTAGWVDADTSTHGSYTAAAYNREEGTPDSSSSVVSREWERHRRMAEERARKLRKRREAPDIPAVPEPPSPLIGGRAIRIKRTTD